MLRGKKIRLHNNGTPVRNWLHVDDTVTAILSVIDGIDRYPGKVLNSIFNISGGFEQTNSETVRKVVESFYGDKRDWKQYVDLSYNRLGQDVRYALNDKKLRDIDWKPKKVFDKEIKSIVDYYNHRFKL